MSDLVQIGSVGSSRRDFLQTTLLGLSAFVTIGFSRAGDKYEFFTEAEVEFLNPAVDRLIPADEKCPGASDLGVVNYIDRQMAGPWGKAEQIYFHGPFIPGPPELGYQLGFTPADLFRRAIGAINDRLRKQGTAFHELSHPQQDELLHALESGKLNLNGVPSDTFFGFLWQHTLEGFFGDPVYGGNRNKDSWRMIGFPGAYTDFYEHVGQHNVPFVREPMSIADAKADPMSMPGMDHKQGGK